LHSSSLIVFARSCYCTTFSVFISYKWPVDSIELVGLCDGIKKFLVVAFKVNISNQRVGSTRRKFEGDFFFKDMFLEEWVFAERSRAFASANEAALRIRSPLIWRGIRNKTWLDSHDVSCGVSTGLDDNFFSLREVKDLTGKIKTDFWGSLHGRRAEDRRWEGEAFRLRTFHDKFRSLLHGSESVKRSLNILLWII